jgi:transposase
MVLGARVLGEFGDDPNRYADAKSRRNYAGTSPVTKASGKSHVSCSLAHSRNAQLASAADQWAFCSLTKSPGARAYYDELRTGHKTHRQADSTARQPVGRHFARLPRTARHYDENLAWKHRSISPLDICGQGVSRPHVLRS